MLQAIETAQDILARHVAPGPRNAEETIDALLNVLDDEDVVEAVRELSSKRADR